MKKAIFLFFVASTQIAMAQIPQGYMPTTIEDYMYALGDYYDLSNPNYPRVKSITVLTETPSGGGEYDWEKMKFDKNGRLIEKEGGNSGIGYGLHSYYYYDKQGRLVMMRYDNHGSDVSRYQGETVYTYDANGHMRLATSIDRTAMDMKLSDFRDTGSAAHTFTTDSLGRVVKWEHTVFDIDEKGKRTKSYEGTTEYTFNDNGQLVSMYNQGCEWYDGVKSAPYWEKVSYDYGDDPFRPVYMKHQESADNLYAEDYEIYFTYHLGVDGGEQSLQRVAVGTKRYLSDNGYEAPFDLEKYPNAPRNSTCVILTEVEMY